MAKAKSKEKDKGKGKKKVAAKEAPARPVAAEVPPHAMDRLHALLETRRKASPTSSYTAKLLTRGPVQVAKKLGEEAVETVIEAVRGDRDKLVLESADLLYHLVTLWIAMDVKPERIWQELARREARSGLEEKRSRAAAG